MFLVTDHPLVEFDVYLDKQAIKNVKWHDKQAIYPFFKDKDFTYRGFTIRLGELLDQVDQKSLPELLAIVDKYGFHCDFQHNVVLKMEDLKE